VTAPFVASAIGRRDGSGADGIHLLWAPPPTVGFSVDGWDVQRRRARGRRPEVRCAALTPAELAALHRHLHLRTSFGRIRVRAAACPEFPPLPPDEPAGPPEPPKRRCASLAKLEPGRGENPRKAGRLTFEVRDGSGAPAPATFIRTWAGFTGLDCGFETVLGLPAIATAVELTLVHLADPAEAEAFNADGSSAGVVRMSGPQRQPETLRLTGPAIARVVIRAPRDETLLLEACVEERARGRPAAQEPAGARSRLPAGRRLNALRASAADRCRAYDIVLSEGHALVEVRVGLPAVLAIGLRSGKAVQARQLADPSGTQTARFEGRDVDEVLLYAATAATALEVCLDRPPDPEQEEREWAGEPFIATNVQVPIRALDGALASEADEQALAASRLLAGERFDAAHFRAVAGLTNAAAADAADAAPVWSSAVAREDVADPFLELRSWPHALALLVDPAWRRVLGFGFLDPGAGLTPGDAYDYRITGRFRRRDLEERLHGFHTVPRGTTLPPSFALGPVALRTPAPAVVELRPTPGTTALTATGRKGVALTGSPCLTISFPEPVQRVVLELAAGSSLIWTATPTDYLPGLPSVTFGGALAADRRVTIETPLPVHTVTLHGTGFLYGVREGPSPAPDEIVTRSVVLPAVAYKDTALPAPPAFLGTLNLQQPAVAAGTEAAPRAPEALGFSLSWLPPPPAGTFGALPWPADLGAYPPFDVLGFHLERRRVDTNGPFEELDGPGLQPLVFGSRSGRRDPPVLAPGIDLEVAFPERHAPQPPVPVFMSLDDVLVTAEHGGPPPGSLHQYRIFSVDAIGRRSGTATVGSIARLEKRRPPPQPVGPPAPPPAGAIAPVGVRARLLVAADPDLAPDDRALLGASANAVVLEWGWTQAERDSDPHATEFRVYWQPLPPDVVSGRLTGAVTLAGGEYEITATLDRALAADAMAGRYLAAPARRFRVVSHTAGQNITVRLAPSALDPAAVPEPAAFEFRPVLDGREQRPPAWAERTAVVPIEGSDTYRHVFRDRVTLDADHPRARVWAGVSAADAQPYVADQLPAGAVNGGRPGNESAIAAADAAGRYLGRPVFSVPPPLADVPEVVTDEPSGDTVSIRVDLPALLPGVGIPAGHDVLLERLSFDDVVTCVSARPDGTVGASLPDGTADGYTLANPDDHAALVAQIRSGTPARVEGRFLMDFLLRFAAALEPLWRPVRLQPEPFGVLSDSLPGTATRYLHRIRLADAAGHLSEGAAIAPRIVRVPSLRSPAPPRLDAPSTENGELEVTARVRDAFDLSWVLLFATVDDAAAPADGRLRRPAQLLRLPNRRDRYPDDGLRLRLPGGALLAPEAVLEAAAGAVEPPDRVLTATLAPGHERRIALWAVAVTRDGVPSRFAGPAIALTGPEPLVPPALTVVSAGGTDTATWMAPAVAALLTLERSTDGGATWRQVSPWLAGTVTSHVLPSATGSVRYRTVLRASRGRRTTGPEVTPG
jgi:hypothetical protein